MKGVQGHLRNRLTQALGRDDPWHVPRLHASALRFLKKEGCDHVANVRFRAEESVFQVHDQGLHGPHADLAREPRDGFFARRYDAAARFTTFHDHAYAARIFGNENPPFYVVVEGSLARVHVGEV